MSRPTAWAAARPTTVCATPSSPVRDTGESLSRFIIRTAFLFPSLYEGFGIPPLEAMACGVPVMASNAASLPEVTGDCAVQVDPYDLDSMANGMEQLYTDAALRQELSRRGPERAKTLTWDQAAADLMKLYMELI